MPHCGFKAMMDRTTPGLAPAAHTSAASRDEVLTLAGGRALPVRVYSPLQRRHLVGYGAPPAPVVLHFHAGAFVEGSLCMLRAEDSAGRAMPDASPAGKIARLSKDDPEAWERILSGSDADLLLLCLNHLSSAPPPGFRYVHEYLRIRKRILELRKSSEPWIREAAEAVILDEAADR